MLLQVKTWTSGRLSPVTVSLKASTGHRKSFVVSRVITKITSFRIYHNSSVFSLSSKKVYFSSKHTVTT